MYITHPILLHLLFPGMKEVARTNLPHREETGFRQEFLLELESILLI